MNFVEFGKYTLLRRLAVGGMAELYLARSSDSYGVERLVALKVIASRYTQNSDFLKMFRDEMRIASTLIHPNIGQVVDVGDVEGRQYLAMEFIHGQDMRSVIRKLREKESTHFPPHLAVYVGKSICAALQHAHNIQTLDGKPMNIIHRDVSPSNIIVSYDGHVKLLDFGIAKAKDRFTMTQPGTIKGKVRYLSPELLLGKEVDHRTDIFTLGVSLWEITVGCHLFEGEQDVHVYDAISKGIIRPPSSLIKDYPYELESIILKALSYSAEDRYQDAREMQNALENYAQNSLLMASDLQTSEYIQHLFADKYQSWRQAKEKGISLSDYLVESATDEELDLTLMGKSSDAIQAIGTDTIADGKKESAQKEKKTILYGTALDTSANAILNNKNNNSNQTQQTEHSLKVQDNKPIEVNYQQDVETAYSLVDDQAATVVPPTETKRRTLISSEEPPIKNRPQHFQNASQHAQKEIIVQPSAPPVSVEELAGNNNSFSPPISSDKNADSKEPPKEKDEKKKAQTGDWSHQNLDSKRPGTHPFFKGDASDFKNPYESDEEFAIKRRPALIILISVVGILIVGTFVLWFLVRGDKTEIDDKNNAVVQSEDAGVHKQDQSKTIEKVETQPEMDAGIDGQKDQNALKITAKKSIPNIKNKRRKKPRLKKKRRKRRPIRKKKHVFDDGLKDPF